MKSGEETGKWKPELISITCDKCQNETHGSLAIRFNDAPSVIGFTQYRIDVYDADAMSPYIQKTMASPVGSLFYGFHLSIREY